MGRRKQTCRMPSQPEASFYYQRRLLRRFETPSAVTKWPPTTFTLFPKLPVELQLQVWESVEIPTSLITVNLSDEIFSNSFDRKSQPCLKVRYRLPAVFHACYTSRKTALQSHPLGFANGLFGPCFAAPFPFNAEKDVLLFMPMDTGVTLAMNCLLDFGTVRQIAIEPGYLDDYAAMARMMVLTFQIGSNINILPNNDLGTRLAAVRKDGTMDYQRIASCLLNRYSMRLMIMELRG
ncbi:hypothetical protein DL98DRAFT_581348 [Cadophora sp. DSE1049]|nr:hypothetical protein DL98DRAFT_581348 [Cadophora sp. DSE1049]